MWESAQAGKPGVGTGTSRGGPTGKDTPMLPSGHSSAPGLWPRGEPQLNLTSPPHHHPRAQGPVLTWPGEL